MSVNDSSPALEVGFVIDTGGSFGELTQLQAAMDSTEAKVLADANRIERATSGMVNVGAATTNIVAFGNAASREMQAARQAIAQVEKGGEALSRQLERQISTFGKTREEIRAAKVETAALNAEQSDLIELSTRLRAQQSALADAEAAVTIGAERQAQALREANHAYQQFEARARQGAIAMAEADRKSADFEATMARVTARVDPSAVAIGRLQTELNEAKLAFDNSRIGAAAYQQEQERITAAAGKLYGPQRQLAGVIHDVGVAQRFTASETLNLSRQFQDIGVTAAMGMNPLMIMVQQGPQIFDVLETAKARGVSAGAAFAQMGKDITGGAVTGFSRLLPLLTPVNLLLAGTAIAVIAGVKSLGSYGIAMQKFEATATGLGRTSGMTATQMEAVAEAAAASGERTIGATRDSVAAFAAAGIQGEQTLTSLAGIVEKYAKLTGKDVPAAQAVLASAMADPAAAADTFTQQLGLLNGAQYEHIQQLAAQGDAERATSELTKILSADLEKNAHQTTGLAHYMEQLGGVVSSVSTMFGKLDQKIRQAGSSYDAWLKQHAGGWAVDLFGTGNQDTPKPGRNAGRNQDQIAALNASRSLNTSGMQEFNKLVAQQSVLQRGLADTTGMTGAQVSALRHDYSAVTDTINANRTATGAWITTNERAHLVAQAQATLAGSKSQREKAAAQQTITRLQLGTQVLTQQERETKSLDAYNKVADKYVKPRTDHKAETLAREAAAIQAQIKNLYALGDAYAASGAEALIAEAKVKAESQAIKQGADISEAVARQVRLAIAQRVSDAEKGAASIRDQARIQTEVNALVADGNIPAEHAAALLRQRVAELPLLAALEVAQQRGYKDEIERATAALKHQRDAQIDAKAAATGDFFAQADASANKKLADLREEMRLVGATNDERTRAMATLKATRELEAAGQQLGTTYADNYIKDQVKIAVETDNVAKATLNMNEALSHTANQWDIIAGKVQSAAQGMADAFGSGGQAIGDLASIYANYNADRTHADVEHAKRIKELAGNQTALARESQLFAMKSSGAQITAFGDMAASAKGFFKEGTSGYKAMGAAEKVYRAAQFAMSLQAMVQSVLETTTHVAGATAQATADGAAGIAAQSKLPFPANIAAMAATGAALVAAGIAVFGGGGGSKAAPVTNTGTGTVLGDSAAKSDSIKNAIDALSEVDTVTNTFARQMAASLKSIDSQIGGVASLVVRSGNIDASSGVTEGFKSNAIGSVLSKIPVIGGLLGGLFGSKTSVIGSGLYGGAQSVGSIVNNGFDASYYSDIEKKKKLFGLTTSTKTSTQYSGADAGLENQFTLILKSFNDAIASAAGPLGVATGDVQARLNSFVVNIGKIDLKGLTGEQIEEKLSAVFGAAADGMAAAAFPGLEQFQKVGEGVFETLVRVASTIEAVGSSLDLLGRGAQAMSIAAKLGLADQFDSVADLTSAAGAYFDAFYTKEEQSAAKTAQMVGVFGSLGVAMPATLASFRSLVEAQDLTTTAGQATYATLLKLAPAFADLQSSMEGAKSAADIASERQDLQRQLLELQGNTAAIRALDLAKLDASNRALQQQIYAIQDAQAAATAAKALADAWTSVGDSIMDEVKRIRGLTDTAATGGFASLMSQFNVATAAARGGDQDAAKSLPALSQALLTAAAEQATSRQELARVQAQTAASLEATYGVVTALTKGGTSTVSPSQILDAVSAAQPAPPAAAANDDLLSEIKSLREEVVGMRSENNSGHAATAGNTGRIDRRLEAVTAPSGGEAITVASVAA